MLILLVYPLSCCSQTGNSHQRKLLLLWRIYDWAWEILLDFPLLFLHRTPLGNVIFQFHLQFVLHTLKFDSQPLSCSSPIPLRTNMSLPVSPCSSPLRQFKQSNWSCLPSPPHPTHSSGASYNALCYTHNQTRRSPPPVISDPWLDVGRMKLQSPYGSPKRFWASFVKSKMFYHLRFVCY
jgi:hypothetical protein